MLCDIDHLRLHVAIPFWYGRLCRAPVNARRTDRRRVVPAGFRDELNTCDGDRSGRGRSRGRGRRRGRGRGRTRPASARPDGESAQEDGETRRAAARAHYPPAETECRPKKPRLAGLLYERPTAPAEIRRLKRRPKLVELSLERPTVPAEMDRPRRRATLAGVRLGRARPLSGRKSPLTIEMRVAYVIEICGVGVWVLLLLRLLV